MHGKDHAFDLSDPKGKRRTQTNYWGLVWTDWVRSLETRNFAIQAQQICYPFVFTGVKWVPNWVTRKHAENKPTNVENLQIMLNENTERHNHYWVSAWTDWVRFCKRRILDLHKHPKIIRGSSQRTSLVRSSASRPRSTRLPEHWGFDDFHYTNLRRQKQPLC